MTAAPEAVALKADETTRLETAYEEAHNTNVFVVLEHLGKQTINAVYGPFRSRNAGKDWGLINCSSFTIMEIMRPRDVEEIAFVLVPKASEPTLEDQGISQDQTEIGDYIDPLIGR